MSNETFTLLLWTQILISVPVFIVLFFLPAPYGKHFKSTWGPCISSKYAWVIMEFPAVMVMLSIYVVNYSEQGLVSAVFILIWLSHYVYRTFVYPFRTNNPSKPFPVVIALMGFLFNILNGIINGVYLFEIRVIENTEWLISSVFIVGLGLFIAGMLVNKKGESDFKRLVRSDVNTYVMPSGGLLDTISNPHYFGELIQWLGWAVLCWSPAGFAFFIFTFANLFPRAILNHRWYKKEFPDFPPGRKAIIPYLI